MKKSAINRPHLQAIVTSTFSSLCPASYIPLHPHHPVCPKFLASGHCSVPSTNVTMNSPGHDSLTTGLPPSLWQWPLPNYFACDVDSGPVPSLKIKFQSQLLLKSFLDPLSFAFCSGCESAGGWKGVEGGGGGVCAHGPSHLYLIYNVLHKLRAQCLFLKNKNHELLRGEN